MTFNFVIHFLFALRTSNFNAKIRLRYFECRIIFNKSKTFLSLKYWLYWTHKFKYKKTLLAHININVNIVLLWKKSTLCEYQDVSELISQTGTFGRPCKGKRCASCKRYYNLDWDHGAVVNVSLASQLQQDSLLKVANH